MPVYIGLEDGRASYVLACPRCNRYDMSMAGVTIKPDDVIEIAYYCVGCHSPQNLTVSGCSLHWGRINRLPSKAEYEVRHAR